MKIILQIAIVFTAFTGASCAQGGDDRLLLSRQKHFSCPHPGVEKFEPWGKSGSARTCEIKNGSFFVVENNKLILTGEYVNGKQVGAWRWYDEQGNVIKVIDYSKENK